MGGPSYEGLEGLYGLVMEVCKVIMGKLCMLIRFHGPVGGL